jgi:outer membrane protein assembly factor BamB
LTTRCCSAVALFTLSVVSGLAARKVDVEPLSLFPVRSIWTLALNNQLAVPAAYDGERGYFAIAGDRLVAYDLATGTQQWLVSARPRMRPAVGDGLIFSIEPDLLMARHVSDGSIAWQLPLTDTLAVPPVWDNGWLVAATSAGSILAFRASDGHLIWHTDLESPAHASPALAADRVYIPTDDGRVVALRVDDGTAIWERHLRSAPGDVLALDDRVYTGSKDQFLYCLMTKDGRVDWRWRTGGPVVGLPTFDEHNVYFTALDNVLRALDRKSGAQKWIRPLPLRPVWGPVRAGTTLIVGGQASTLRAYSVTDGKAAGDLSADAEVSDAPRVFDDAQSNLPRLLVVTRDIAKGAAVRLVTHTFDPESTVLTAPLPNIISMSPTPTEKP